MENVEDITVEPAPDKSALVEQPKELTGNVLRYLQALSEIAEGAARAEAETVQALRMRTMQTESARAKLDNAVTHALMECGVMPGNVSRLDMKTGKIELK